MSQTEVFQFFAKYIERELGIVYAEHNFFQLQNRLEEITKQLNLKTIDELYILAKKGIDGQFKQLLLDRATNNETSFFRDPRVFFAIEKLVSEHLANQNLRIWSAASSTGQEAISTAVLIEELSAKLKKNISYSILGTDISERVLQKAKSGLYSQLEVQRGLSAELLNKYFLKSDADKWKILPSIQGKMEFKTLNLKDSFLVKDQFHILLCRNVLIYQSVESKKEILQRLTRNIIDGGYLVLGSGESLLGLSTDFDQLTLEGAVIFRKKGNALKNVA